MDPATIAIIVAAAEKVLPAILQFLGVLFAGRATARSVEKRVPKPTLRKYKLERAIKAAAAHSGRAPDAPDAG